MVNQRLHSAADRILITIPIAQHARILAVRRMALDDETLPQPKLARLIDLLPTIQNARALPNRPKVVGRRIDMPSTVRTPTVRARRKVRGEGLRGAELHAQSVPAEEGVVVDDGGGAFRGGEGAHRGVVARGHVEFGEAVLLLAEGGDGAFAGGVGGGGKLGHVGAGELAVVVEGVLEDVDDGLLELDDLLLEEVLCYRLGRGQQATL